MAPTRFVPAGALALWLALGCGGDGTGPEPTRTVAVHEGNNQTATVAQPVTVAPAVRVTTGSGSPVSGATVTFSVTAGGGTLTGATATSGADGVARVGGWTLGQVAGANTLSAQLEGGGGTVSFTATGAADQPASVTKTSGDGQSATTRAAVAAAPAVRVADQFDNPVPGVSVAFEVTAGGGSLTGAAAVTGANGVAAVGSWQLGPTAGPNGVTATVVGQGIANNPVVFTATALELVLQPAQDTTLLGGTAQWTRLVIPAGRTVTVAGNLVLNVDSSVTIAGTLQGDCVALTINGQQEVVVTGTVANGCTADVAEPPALTIVGRGGFDVTNATLTSTGDIDLTNDPDLDDDDIPIAAGRLATATSGPPMGTNGVICGVGSLSAPKAKDGSSTGAHGTNGRNGRTWTLRCRGDLSIGGTVAGQDGGDGGNGTDNTGTANASGGHGGDGGRLVVKATGIVGLGSGSTLRSGRGGTGGQAIATAQESDAGTRAPGATAVGGRGGDPGLITVRAGAGIQVSAGATFELGVGGNGGDATAVGANGKDATAAKAAQHGGHATATGGAGGSLDANRLRAFGNVLGGPIVTGGDGGAGGTASATGGTGGNSAVEEHPNGGDGGNFTGTGGDGGDAQARDLAGLLFGTGGPGGAVFLAGGTGGVGFNGCIPDPDVPGGDGGKGGNADGADGQGGSGLASGDPGGVTYTNAGNGGKAGDGAGPGTRGAAGAEAGFQAHGPVVKNGVNFELGAPGQPCGIPAGKGAARVIHHSVPAEGVPQILAHVLQGDEVVAEITSADQQLILDPGSYLLESVAIDPDGFNYVAGVCLIDGEATAVQSTPAAEPPAPCGFTIAEGILIEIARTYLARRALLNWIWLGLPPGTVVPLVFQFCGMALPCTGFTKDGFVPGSIYLRAGLWAVLVNDLFLADGFRLNRYRAIPPGVLTLVAATIYNPALTFYLFQSLFYYHTTAVVKLDPWLHAVFVAMWTTAVVELVRQYLEPSAVAPTSGEEGDVAITLTAPAPWVPLTGVLKPDGTITASGTGTVAGFPNVPVTFTGVLNANGTISGELRMGQDTPPTGLPNGSIVYQIDGMPVAPPSAPPQP